MTKIIVICGPTATGKTALGIQLAREFNGEIISADSRQVYKDMDIGTGKGLNENSKFLKTNNQSLPGFYIQDEVKIWGYDLVESTSSFNIAAYRERLVPVISHIHQGNKPVIIVGGTGFYIRALIDPPKTVGVAINQDLRKRLDSMALDQLQQELSSLEPAKLDSMNNSDRHNPRRLIRAIEVAMASKSRGVLSNKPPRFENEAIWIGLTTSLVDLKKRVESNVVARATEAFSNEIRSLETRGLDWDSPAASATGYQEWRAYLQGEISKAEAIEQWITREHQYQKRQLTWFKKLPQIKWFDITQEHTNSEIAVLVRDWYSNKKE